MSHELVICLVAIAANLGGMLVIYAALSHALARLAWRGRGVFAVITLILVAQLFWIAPAVWIVDARGASHAGSYALWFGNWLATGFSLVVFWKSTARIPMALGDIARLDGLGGVACWRHTILPFVRRDLVIVAIFTVMATLLPYWGTINLPEPGNVITIFERNSSFAENLVKILAGSILGAIPLIGILILARRRSPAPDVRA